VVPPSQWRRTRLVVQQTSSDPAAEAQLRRQREDGRRNWEAARAIAPQVREAKRQLEEELLPQADAAMAAAVAAVEAAQNRLVLKNVAEQGNEVWDVGGRPVVLLTTEDQEKDRRLREAQGWLQEVRAEAVRLRAHLDAANQHLNLVENQAPPPEA
jgi:hypothetical protein